MDTNDFNGFNFSSQEINFSNLSNTSIPINDMKARLFALKWVITTLSLNLLNYYINRHATTLVITNTFHLELATMKMKKYKTGR